MGPTTDPWGTPVDNTGFFFKQTLFIELRSLSTIIVSNKYFVTKIRLKHSSKSRSCTVKPTLHWSSSDLLP